MQVFSVQGMTCGHCIRAIEVCIRAQDSTAQVQVDLAQAEVRVASRLAAGEIIAAISAQGYEAALA